MLNFCPQCGYKLLPEEGNPSQNTVQQVAGSVIDEYSGTGIKVAVPGVLDNRKRLMQLRNRPVPIIRPVRNDGEMDKFGDLIIGEGLQQEG